MAVELTEIEEREMARDGQELEEWLTIRETEAAKIEEWLDPQVSGDVTVEYIYHRLLGTGQWRVVMEDGLWLSSDRLEALLDWLREVEGHQKWVWSIGEGTCLSICKVGGS